MNIRDLEYIVAVGEHGSFSYAAEVCNVSQPSLSTQVKKVEDQLGVQLFNRSRRKVEITSYGVQFIEKAEEILNLLDEIRELADHHAGRIEGRIVLGAILTIAPYIFSDIVNTVSNQAPFIDLVLKETTTEMLIKGMLLREVDAAIISLPTDENVFESCTFFEEPFYLAVAEGHPLAASEVIRDEQLKGRDLILLEEGHCFRNQALEICRTTTARENEVFQATSLETIRHVVASGAGITLMPAVARKENDGLVYIPMENAHFKREIGLVWHKSSPKQVLIHRLIELIQDAL